MPRILKPLVAFCLALVAGLALAACGGDDNADLDPAAVLAETLGNDEHVSSGTFDFTLNGSVEGEASGSGEVSLSGAFQSDPDDPAALPQLQLDGSVSGDAAGQTVEFDGGLVVTADNAYITYQDETYEVGASLFNAFGSLASQAMAAQGAVAAPPTTGTTGAEGEEGATPDQCAALLEAEGGNADACEVIDVYSWLDLTNEGTEDVEGTDTIHIHGAVDVPAMIDNLNEAIAAAGVTGTEEIPEETAAQIEEGVSELSFDVYSGAEDNLLRGFDLNVSLDAAGIEGADDAGVTSADVELSTRLGAVNEQQTIEAPADAQPIDDLLEQFGLSSADLQSQLSGGLGSLSESP